MMFQALDQLVECHCDGAQDDDRSDHHVSLEEVKSVSETDRQREITAGKI